MTVKQRLLDALADADALYVGDVFYYKEVVAVYESDPVTPVAIAERDAAFLAEQKSPERWDDIAIKEIARRSKVNLNLSETEQEEKFQAWYQKVNQAIEQATGLSANDLPDVCYRDWFDAGNTPVQAARKAIRSAKEDMGL